MRGYKGLVDTAESAKTSDGRSYKDLTLWPLENITEMLLVCL